MAKSRHKIWEEQRRKQVKTNKKAAKDIATLFTLMFLPVVYIFKFIFYDIPVFIFGGKKKKRGKKKKKN